MRNYSKFDEISLELIWQLLITGKSTFGFNDSRRETNMDKFWSLDTHRESPSSKPDAYLQRKVEVAGRALD